jgi:type VI protein secretion system component VasK
MARSVVSLPLSGRPALRMRRRLSPWLQQAQPVAWVLMACLIVGCMAILYLSTQTQSAAIKYNINSLNDDETALLQQESDLRLQADQLESLQRIHTDAAKLGLTPVKPGEVTYLSVPVVNVTPTAVPYTPKLVGQP